MTLYPKIYDGRDTADQKFFSYLDESGGNIDLRAELSIILRGDGGRIKPMGHWVVYRRFDRNTHSEYYDEISREGVHGPQYKYTDELILTRRQIPDRKAEIEAQPGIVIAPRLIYYFEYIVEPKEQDQIFEFNWSNHLIQPTFDKIRKPYTDMYNIELVDRHRMDNGRTEFFAVIALRDTVNY